MFEIAPVPKVYLCTKPMDLRKGIDGLMAEITFTLRLDPFSESLFVFLNRKRDKLKILQWSNNGWWIHYRKLAEGTFDITFDRYSNATPISATQLRWLIDGLELEQPRAFSPVAARNYI